MQMRLELIEVPRRPPWPLWAAALCVAWLALVAATVYLSAAHGLTVGLCTLKRLTGLPCPTCGSGRGVLAALGGRIGDAWLCNPLLFTVLGAWGMAILLRLLFARAIRLQLSPPWRRTAWLILAALLLANWAYVIRFVG